MFQLADNEEIGQYLREKILEKFESGRQFCGRWLAEENKKIDNVELQRRTNKLAQIQNGKKSIQIEDLPIFSRILGLSCEEILSAGQSFVENSGHLTNYHVAFTDDPELWEAYVQREDRIFLSSDEYDKTVIDYALEFKNYKLLKFLMDRGHISFVSENDINGGCSFGATTDIERKPVWEQQNLENKIRGDDSFRRRLISLALENGEMGILKTMRAREVPPMRFATFISTSPIDCSEFYDEKMLRHLAALGEEELEYFFEEFDVKSDVCRGSNTFVFPFAGELAELLVENDHSYCDVALEKCYEYNLSVVDRLKEMSEADLDEFCASLYDPSPETKRAELAKERYKFLYISKDGRMISYMLRYNHGGFTTNLIRINAESSTKRLNRLIGKINELYDWVAEHATISERR